MTDARIMTLLDRIDRALLAEIEVVQDGRFDELRAVQEETAAAMRELDGSRDAMRAPGLDKPGIEAAMARIRQRADQARGLIGAAMHGARDARTRLEALIRADGDVGAYDRSGGQLRMKAIGSPYNKTL
ncbi:hypothetical protein [uncultured Algimonas sp.]|uniref:hypothetical protein n=1 Tax=uncultured Algimonas sp. TaxID=1547920 RepID=UPI002608C96D|nr:hypothetical protein [uncultured Algimonas sp.]